MQKQKYRFSFEIIAASKEKAILKMYEKFDKDISDYGDLFKVEFTGLTEHKVKEHKVKEMPFVAIGNNELGDEVGETAIYPNFSIY